MSTAGLAIVCENAVGLAALGAAWSLAFWRGWKVSVTTQGTGTSPKGKRAETAAGGSPPLGAGLPVQGGARPAGSSLAPAGQAAAATTPLSVSLRDAESRHRQYAEWRDGGMGSAEAAGVLRLSDTSRKRYERIYRQAPGNGAGLAGTS